MSASKHVVLGVIIIERFKVSQSTKRNTLFGNIRADYLKPYAGEVDGRCRKVPFSLGEGYYQDSDRVYLGQPEEPVGDEWVEVDTWDQFTIASREQLAGIIFRFLKGIEGGIDWTPRKVKQTFEIVNIGTKKDKEMVMIPVGKATAAVREDTPCPFA